jgi:hypothetical protein
MKVTFIFQFSDTEAQAAPPRLAKNHPNEGAAGHPDRLSNRLETPVPGRPASHDRCPSALFLGRFVRRYFDASFYFPQNLSTP